MPIILLYSYGHNTTNFCHYLFIPSGGNILILVVLPRSFLSNQSLILAWNFQMTYYAVHLHLNLLCCEQTNFSHPYTLIICSFAALSLQGYIFTHLKSPEKGQIVVSLVNSKVTILKRFMSAQITPTLLHIIAKIVNDDHDCAYISLPDHCNDSRK